MEFKEFESIEILESLVIISEKIHGTNAQIAIDDSGQNIYAGSRNRWITPEDDNYGFATWVYANKTELLALLGPGRHFGEWYGSGIGPGYGLKEKRFALFNTYRWTKLKQDGLLLPQMDVVPVLYSGTFTPTITRETMDKLKKDGSSLVPGYMKPEGVVIFFSRTKTYLKQVFEKEDTGWDKKEKKEKAPNDPALDAEVATYLQPVRLEKLIMRDDRYLRDYPKSLGNIASDYIADLLKESQPIEPKVLAELRKKVFVLIREKYGK
jgi:hypothetical protein